MTKILAKSKLRSNEPFWLVKNGLLNSFPSTDRDIETEIVVIGGGITGALIAHQMIEDGHDTVLVDRREIAHGSTAATTSMLQYEIDVPLHRLIGMIGEEGAVASYRACSDAIDRLGEISKEINSECGFEKKESLYFASRKKDVRELKEECETRGVHGFPVAWLEADEIEETYGLRETQGGILSRQGGSIDAFRFAHDLLRYDCERGLRVFDKTDIEDIQYKLTGVKLKTAFGNSVTAKHLIYCNGYESTEIVKDKFVQLKSTYAIVGEAVDGDLAELDGTLFWNTADPYSYIRTTDDHRLLIGGADEDFVDAAKRDELLDRKANKLAKELKRLMPDRDFRIDFAWAGTFGETKDGLPYIGPHPKFPSTYFVLGFGGNGITFSVVGMQLVSQMLRGERPPLAEYFKFRR